ncbi:Glyoxylase, beta-lactamase superfamily II [Jannaschia faecimaris]|uniref:Glyoxylase, beta-lactamase superfamily II n=1 Tax=Jannaschia faecimaris TaxID=1244108 RepID=A0A1H3SJV7_9RHOB|nr:MBL fold metallo-hydrolase [Jannaschia faecimaris]SDZ37990.1 Glyoxylase, beta-lactamase superfamily II [Jannaschia faecimaris]
MDEGYPSGESKESGLIRVLAPNPSPMTYGGTNSFVLGHDDVAVIDPGPAIPAHLDALQTAIAGRPVRAILVTHSHLDHSPGAEPLRSRLGNIPVLAFGASHTGRSATMTRLTHLGGGEGLDHSFAPDALLAQGDEVAGDGWTLRAHHTPGHMANHLSFEWSETRAVFTGDTIMGWASTMISPPDGDLGQFMASLDILEALDAATFHCGHGGPVGDPTARCRALRAHRLTREASIFAALPDAPTIPELVARIYADTPAALHGAAARNVLAHLIHLVETKRAVAFPDVGPDATYEQS